MTYIASVLWEYVTVIKISKTLGAIVRHLVYTRMSYLEYSCQI
ncbi:hypothetical protein APHNP_0060 [Anaplasma phagocytophilum str. ApNP]|uniref:Uncharacterized protein n=1 Tax=Anaplasma phagocytophilum str. ApNP TaxID=1359153 RepID=A0A0F3NF98_ANAPH|nr:hypothetical protein APHNP_0060 [Anaplasma phagocytophilum str. ApNP]